MRHDMRLGTTALDDPTAVLRDRRAMGPVGVLARLGVGLRSSYVALFGRSPSWVDPLVAVVVMPGAVANAPLHRDDEVACVVFTPVDAVDGRLRGVA